ncbi:hypothetical protein D9X91_08285 [Falsibacillus albus]|uniref:Uncharacterized protein n=1 Tax=Falsibacillus albus TaxID=2478915 RepID=A0A3L7JZR2_9BACI|nr:hypothetical protein D9X91_08285 [Falsibacillus albus]
MMMEKTMAVDMDEKKAEESCFITDSCVDARGLPDDCFELKTFRKFRDEVLLQSFKEKKMLKGSINGYSKNGFHLVLI